MTFADLAVRPTLDRDAQPVRLNPSDRDQVLLLARALAYAQPQDTNDPRWLAQVRGAASALPATLRSSLRAFRHDAGDTGVLIIDGLPVETQSLPATPAVPGSAESLPSEHSAIAALIGYELGELVSYAAEKSGALVHNIVPVAGHERSQSNAGSVTLSFHVENAFHANRPDYVGLLCLRSDHLGLAGTLVASIRQALPLVPAVVQDILRQRRFETAAPPSFAGHETSPIHAVLTGAAEDPDICADLSATTGLDAEAANALVVLGQALSDAAVNLVLHPGQMALIDNRLALHGRTQFEPRYDGNDRWLHRVYIHLDNRRSRGDRRAGGPVME